MTRVLRYACWTLITGLLMAAAVGAWRTFTVVDTAAITAMDADELAYLKHLRRPHRGMTVDEVVAVLGQPGSRRESLGGGIVLGGYAVPGRPLTQATVRLDQQGAREIALMKLGHFSYRYRLQAEAHADAGAYPMAVSGGVTP